MSKSSLLKEIEEFRKIHKDKLSTTHKFITNRGLELLPLLIEKYGDLDVEVKEGFMYIKIPLTKR